MKKLDKLGPNLITGMKNSLTYDSLKYISQLRVVLWGLMASSFVSDNLSVILSLKAPEKDHAGLCPAIFGGGTMTNLKRLTGLLLILAAFLVSCTKLEPAAGKEGTLPIISLSQSDSIPSDWGNLVSTTISPDRAKSVLLWFQNEKGDIHLASFNITQNKLDMRAVMIGRD